MNLHRANTKKIFKSTSHSVLIINKMPVLLALCVMRCATLDHSGNGDLMTSP